MTEILDTVSSFLYCPFDQTVMLLSGTTNEYSLPGDRVTNINSWLSTICKDVEDIIGAANPVSVLRTVKLSLTSTGSNLYHIVFLFRVDNDQKKKSKSCLGKYRGRIRWLTETDMAKLFTSTNLKSPELYEFYYMCKNQSPPIKFLQPVEYSVYNNLCEISSDKILVVGKSNIYENMVATSDFNKSIQENFLKDFFAVCFPYAYMNVVSFYKVISTLGWSKEDAPQLFSAADLNNRNGLSFREYLYIIVATDPGINHAGPVAEARCKYIFRFYDKDKDSLLSPSEFKEFILGSRKARKIAIGDCEKEFYDIYKSLNWDSRHSVTLGEFLKAVSETKIKGTTQMFRSQKTSQQFNKEITERMKVTRGSSARTTRVDMGANANADKATVDYSIALHAVNLQKSGTAINISPVLEIKDAISQTAMKLPVSDKSRRISQDIFNQKSVANELLKSLRYLVFLNKRTNKQAKVMSYSWGQLEPSTFCKQFIAICGFAKNIMKAEPRLWELTAPVYILGDFHGNISDLLYFERCLWHIGPTLCPCKLLFLGDYVDRGAFSMEVIAYLFAYKIQAPNKVILLRGNHEIRDVQKLFTFPGELNLKFGDKLGAELFNAINTTFDVLPLAAVIDKKIFCCHGGIPPPWVCPVLSAINEIPCPLYQPEIQSSLAWDLMWNDPVRSRNIDEKLSLELMANEGFAVNQRRGTAHLFNEEALVRFLKSNQLSHVVRAHEVAQAGFHLHYEGKMLTVFSSSSYGGGPNDAACVLADQAKLRLLRLETEK